MRYVNFAISVILCVAVCFSCACFSLGVENMTEYNTRFPCVHAVEWNFDTTKKDMSEFVGDDETDDSSSTDVSDLNAVVDIKAYRAIAVEASDGGNSEYTTAAIEEIALYFYYEGEEDATLTYGIFVSDKLPADGKTAYTMIDIESTESNVYEEGIVFSTLDKDDMLVYSSVSLAAKSWSSIYVTLSSKISINSGQYLVFVFFENNDYGVSVTESTDSSSSSSGSEKKYKYTFLQYTDNDVAFSFDKVLLYISE